MACFVRGFAAWVLLVALAGCAQGGGGGRGPRPGTDGGGTVHDGGSSGYDAGPSGYDAGPSGYDAGPSGVDGGPACVSVDCDDGDMCTMDVCTDGACSHPAVSCDDGDACTTDSCDPSTGCAHELPTVMGDTCSAAIDVSAGGSFSGDSTCGASDFSGGCGAGDAPDVYFTFTLSGTSDVVIDSAGTSFDSVLSLGTSCSGGELGCDDDSAGGGAARIDETGLVAGTYYVILDGKSGSSGGAWSLTVSISAAAMPETVNFPTSGDTVSPSHGYLWELGSYWEGSRSTSVASTTSVDIHLVIGENVLSCDTQDMRLLLNGTEAGRFTITSTTTAIDTSFSGFGTVSGPTYTLRYENVRAVSGGCGSAKLSTTGSTVTLNP